MDHLFKTPAESDRNFILKHVYKIIPESVPPIAVYGALGVVGLIMLKGVLK